jgi:hypothetical protein
MGSFPKLRKVQLRDRQELTALVGRQNASTRLDQTAEPDSVISFRALKGRAIAAGVAADAAQGAVHALTSHIRDGMVVPERGAPAEAEQLVLFASAG